MREPGWLYLIRHGEVETRYHRVFGGKIDMELSPAGHLQVEALAGYFQKVRLDSIYASPMRRVHQTLAPLVRQSGLAPTVLEGLREVDFGVWTGLRWDEVQDRYQVSAFQWLEQLEIGGIAEAETVPDFRDRVARCLHEMVQDCAGRAIAIVCHGGVIRMLLALLLDLPFRSMAAFEIEYASVTRVKYRPGKVELDLLNLALWRDVP